MFTSDSSTDARVNLCFNSVLTDVVSDSLTLSVMTRVIGDQVPQYGFYSRMIANGLQGVPVWDTLPPGEVSTGWQQQKLSFGKDQLTDYKLEFGFWVRGAGTLALDDFTIQLDGATYADAMLRSIPPVPNSVMARVKNSLIPLASDGLASRMNDYSWLRSVIGDANIVLLGEGTHGTREFTEQRSAITRYLVEEMGYRTVALEANLPEADWVNQNLALATSEDSLHTLIEGLGLWMYNTEEFTTFLQWVQDYNRTHGRPLEIRGIDMQDARVALEKVAQHAHEIEDSALQNLLDSVEANVNDPIRSVEWATSLTDYLESLSTTGSTERMQRYARVVLHSLTAQALRGSDMAAALRYRDEKMAENAEWLTKRATGERVVIWAHNVHIQRSGTAMGSWLIKRYGKQMVSIGMTTGRGTYLAVDPWSRTLAAHELKAFAPESWEYYLQHTGAPAFFLDLRSLRGELASQSLRRMRGVGAIATPKSFLPADIAVSFDGLIYIDSTDAVTPFRTTL